MRAVLVALIVAYAVLVTGCTKTKEVVIEQTVIVKETVVVTATPPAATFKPEEAIGIVQAHPGLFARDNVKMAIGVAVNTECFFLDSQASVKWQAEFRGTGRWVVTATCSWARNGQSFTATWQWQMYEEGPRVLPLGESAARITQ